MRGTIKKLVTDRGFGFIKPEHGRDHFFLATAIVADADFEQLAVGQTVQFDSTEGERGMRAINVAPVTHGTRTANPVV